MIRRQNDSPQARSPVSGQTLTQGTAPAGLVRKLAFDRRGSTAMMFALIIYPVMMLVGFGVDYSRTLAVRVRMQAILDAAALAAARAAQTASSADIINAADTAARGYFDIQDINQVVAGSKKIKTPKDDPSLANAAKTEFSFIAEAWVQTPFMNAASMLITKQAASGASSYPTCASSWWSCQKVSSTASSLLQAGNGDESIEVSMMLDVTGSMGGTKIDVLRDAAKDAVDILIWPDQTKATSKIALAPFAQAVDVGSFAAAVTGRPATSTGSVKTASGGNKDDGKSAGTGKLRPCVIERLGPNAYTDEAPSATNGWIGSYGANNAPSGYSYNDSLSSEDADYSSDGTCSTSIQEKATIVPLTSNKEVLNKRITDMELGGGTAGHLGTAWAWYLLSPKWNSIWPEGSKPAAYGTAKLKKIAILMTDGDYNTDYSSGSSKSKAETLCTNMKTATIEVYTVGFMVSDAAKTMLKACATDHSHFYDASNGDALRMAFRDIALKISSLRLSK